MRSGAKYSVYAEGIGSYAKFGTWLRVVCICPVALRYGVTSIQHRRMLGLHMGGA